MIKIKLITLKITVKNNGVDYSMHPVIIKDNHDLILVDCCLVGNWSLIKDKIREHDINPNELTKIIVTHQDHDHIGTLEEIKMEIPNVKIYSSKIEAPYIEGNKKSLRLEQVENIYPTLSEEEKINSKIFQEKLKLVPKINVDVLLEGNEEFDWCGGIKIILTPGHMPGHICVYSKAEKILIAGDSMTSENGILKLPNPKFTLDMEEAKKSINNLLNLDIEKIVCFHGGLVEGNIKEKIKQILEI